MHHATAAQAADAPTLNLKRTVPWIVYIIFFGVLNETMFNVSTPSIAAQFQLQPSGVSWIITSFIIFFGIGSVIYGKLSDLYSLKKLITIGIIIYTIGSVLGFALQSSYLFVILARALQGAGASAIPALIMVVVARYFSPSDRGKVFGMLTSTVSFSVGVGPVIGGFISGHYHWSFLFIVPVFTLISLPFFRSVLPDEEPRPGRVDVPGAFMLGFGLASLVLFLTYPEWYYLTASAVLLIAFVFHIRRTPEPFIEPKLLRNRLFRVGLIVGFIVFCIVMGIMFVLPLLLSKIYGLDTTAIGWIMFPGAISAVVFGTVGGNLADKKGSSFVVYLGAGLLIASLLLISCFVGMSAWLISGSLLLTYIGFSFIQTALSNSVSLTLKMEETGVGMGLFNLIGFISGAVGTAVVGKILDSELFDFRFHPLVGDPASQMYANLLLLFAVVVAIGISLYYRAYGKKSQTL
ncbi:MFS transporter [Paenibacillus hamazuiensis]|uniref:MFS transporter n=1 Tax=Paenibacillus hamazuiensis TaxID=2936508 RepID=UPI00200E6BFA|nr:MFS transporter [Paenibacillus hamazuiensis]